MFSRSTSFESQTQALVPVNLHPDPDWQPIFHLSNQVVLYNPTSHALSIRPTPPRDIPSHCPYCHRPYDEPEQGVQESRASNYFHLLAVANETSSRPGSPPIEDSQPSSGSRNHSGTANGSAFSPEAMAEGYFKAFFQEEHKLGMGANGSVYLCQHVLDGNPLGHFAVKKIAVGESHSYLLSILREVRLLERLHHPNIITYHHAWLETCQFSSFGPKVPTLHVLMQWAEGGSLDDFISARLGQRSSAPFTVRTTSSFIDPTPPSSAPPSSVSTPRQPTMALFDPSADTEEDSEGRSRAARIRAFRAIQRAAPEEREHMRQEFNNRFNRSATESTLTAVHLLSAEELRSLFGDIVEGLAFLHDKSILHLDLKPGNVLLTWDEGKLVPRAMLSDFGTSRDMLRSSRVRSGNTGTLEYTSPESLPSPKTGLLQQISSQADMWSLGMILHKLLFFRLPYRYASDSEESGKLDQLESEVLSYGGFKSTASLVTAFETRRLPRAYLILLESLLHTKPGSRPSCERVASALREGKLDPVPDVMRRQSTSLIQVPRRTSPPPTTDTSEKGTALRLPPPPGSTPERVFWQYGVHMPRATIIRIFKSGILCLKMASLFGDGDLQSSVVYVLLVLGIVDTLSDNMWWCGVLGCVHFGVLRLYNMGFSVDI